jgi:hypothetical protein
MRWARANKGSGFSAVLDWYLNRDIAHFDPYAPAPMTAYKKKAIELSKSPLEAFAKELAEWTRENCSGVAAFTATQLSVLCERWGYDARAKTQYIRRAIESQGEIEPSRVIKINGKTQRYTTFQVTPVQVTVKSWVDIVAITEKAILSELEN